MTKSGSRLLLYACAALMAVGAMNSPLLAAQTKAAASAAKVDLNAASEKDLEDLPGVGPATAKKIIAGRPYSSVDGLSKAGVSAATLKKITPLVMVGGSAAAAPMASAKTPPAAPPPVPAAPSKPATPTPSKAASSTPPPASQGTPGPGMVWVNLTSGVYHYPSSQFYGKTKSGKYMAEADAVKAGYHAAKDEKKPQ